MSRAQAASAIARRTAPANSVSATRDKILRAATPLFEAAGEHGTTIRQVAAAADVNSQLIYYYFGDKDGLFRAALEAVADRVSELLADAGQGDGSPRSRLARFIAAWVRVTLAEAQAVRMLHRAMLEGNEALAAAIQRHAILHAAQIAALIAEGIKGGVFRADLDPHRAVASLVGMVQYLALAQPILEASAGAGGMPDEPDATASHTAELFLRGLDIVR
jgi:TetR/AcrR family transcriptional regulator